MKRPATLALALLLLAGCKAPAAPSPAVSAPEPDPAVSEPEPAPSVADLAFDRTGWTSARSVKLSPPAGRMVVCWP